MNEYKKVIAVDFDGCMCKSKWPEIGEPNRDVIARAKAERENGAELVLWTCRTGEKLDAALAACKSWGLEFDAVNDNTESRKALYGDNPRKISANEYWDDRAVRTPGWTDVRDAVPERDGHYLVRYGFEHDGVLADGPRFTQVLDYYASDEIPHFQHASLGVVVTHWAELPPPPEGEK